MSYKKWVNAEIDKAKASALSEKLNIDAFVAFLLVSRGIDDELAVSEFLSDGCRFSSPFSFKDPSRCEKNSLTTGLWVRAERVMGVINSFPAGVMTTCTSAPRLMRPRMMRQDL